MFSQVVHNCEQGGKSAEKALIYKDGGSSQSRKRSQTQSHRLS